MSVFSSWIEEKEWALFELRDRLSLLMALQELLDEKAIDGKVRVANKAVFRMARDTYEMLIIDLASFFNSLLQKGPGLNQLNNYLSKLEVGREPRPGAPGPHEPDHILQTIVYGHRGEAFRRLFPECDDRIPAQSDVRSLKDRLDKKSSRCRKLRDEIHAHRYERRRQTDAEPLALVDIAVLFDEAEQTFNDLRLLVLDSTFGYGDAIGVDETAEDLRDIILHGSINRFCGKLGIGGSSADDPYYWQRRDVFYQSESWTTEKDAWKFSD